MKSFLILILLTLSNLAFGAGSFVDLYTIGKVSSTSNKVLDFDNGIKKGALRYNYVDGQMQVSDNGVDFRPIGEGGSLAIYASENFETFTLSNAVSGSSTTFLGGGTLNGTLSIESVSPISKKKSLKYVAGASSLNDYFALPAVALDDKQKSLDSGLSFTYTWSGTSDVEVVVWDVGNAQKLNSVLNVVKNKGSPTQYSAVFTPVSGTANVQLGFHFLTSPTASDTLVFDDVEFSTDPFTYKQLTQTNSIFLENNDGRVITAGTEDIQFSGTGSGWTSTGDTHFYSVQNSDSVIQISISTRFTAAATDRSTILYKNGVSYKRVSFDKGSSAITKGEYTSSKGEFAIGDQLSFRDSSGGTIVGPPRDHYLNIVEQWDLEHVVTPTDQISSENISFIFKGSGVGALDCTSDQVGTYVTYDYTTNGTNTRAQCAAAPTIIPTNADGIRLIGSAGASRGTDSCADPSVFKVCIGRGLKAYDIFGYTGAGKTGDLQSDFVQNSSTVASGITDTYSADGTLTLDAGFSAGATETSRTVGYGVNTLSNPTTGFFHFSAGSKTDLSATPIPKVAYVSYEIAGNGGTATPNFVHTRLLNTVRGDDSFLSLSANQITLNAGEYLISASAIGYRLELNQLYFFNVTDSNYDIEGLSIYTRAGDFVERAATLRGPLIITSTKTFELRHWVGSGGVAVIQNFGNPTHTGTNNPATVSKYAVVTIEKLR